MVSDLDLSLHCVHQCEILNYVLCDITGDCDGIPAGKAHLLSSQPCHNYY